MCLTFGALSILNKKGRKCWKVLCLLGMCWEPCKEIVWSWVSKPDIGFLKVGKSRHVMESCSCCGHSWCRGCCSVSMLIHQNTEDNVARRAPLLLQPMGRIHIHIQAPSCRRMESICEARLGRVMFSVLQLESRPHMGGCEASAIVSSSWLLAEATQVYRGVKVINTSSGGLRFVLVVWKRKTN